MRGGERVPFLILAGLVAGAGLVVPADAAAKERKPAAPSRGWVVDKVRLENLAPEGFLTVGGTGDVRGVVDVVAAGGGLAVINELGLDDYLRGVAEVPATWPPEAQRAQAIAARTFALHEMTRPAATDAKAVGAHICATQACQVYLGVAKERQEQGRRWVEAVESTRNQVLLYKGEPILAMYSSSNGGRSVAGGRPYLKSVTDPESAKGPYNHWTVHFGYGQLTSLFGLPAPLFSLRRDGDAVVLDWRAAGGTAGQTLVPVGAFRDKLNAETPPQADLPRAVPSTQFSVLADDQSGTATLDGRGHGHGIGMSQFGALGKAARGQRAGDILASYYGGLRPVTAAPETLPATIRVALSTGQGSVAVGGTGRFRLLDGSGSSLAVAAHGTWRVQAAGKGKVRVVPPLDQEPAPVVEGLAVRGPDEVGPPGEARFRLGSAALVQVRVEGASLPAPVDTGARLVEPGDVAVALPALPAAGRYVVSVLADAGAGRVTSVVAKLRVRTLVPAASVPLMAGAGPNTQLPRQAAVAWVLLLSVVVFLRRLAPMLRAGPAAGR